MTPAPAIHGPHEVRSARRLRPVAITALLTGAFLLLQPATSAFAVPATVNLGTTGDFSILAGSAVTNTGPTIISGDAGQGGNLA